jgi:hypothetical protein
MKPASGFWGFLARLMGNSYRDTFAVRLGSTLILGQFGIVGPLADFVGLFLRGVLGLVMETGVFQLDLLLDSYREGKKIPEFEKAATEAYAKATAKIYDEGKKNEIRKEYLEILSKIVPVGNGPNTP